MARKPNYDFERREREKAKAAKTAEKVAARKAEKEKKRPTATGPPGGDADPMRR